MSGSKTFMDRIRENGEVADAAAPIITGLVEDVAGLTEDVGGNVEDIAALGVRMTTAEGAITGVQDRAATLEAVVPAVHQVQVASTEDIADLTAIVAAQVIDGVTIAEGDLVLLKDQTNSWENGIYTVTETGLVRAGSANTEAKMVPRLILVLSGTTGSGKLFQCMAYDPTETTGGVTIVARNFAA